MDLFDNNYQERVEISKALHKGPRSLRFSKPQVPAPRHYHAKPSPKVSVPRRSADAKPSFTQKQTHQNKFYNKSPVTNKSRTEDGRPICFKFNRPDHIARYCRVNFVRIVEVDPQFPKTRVKQIFKWTKEKCWILDPHSADLSVVDLRTALFASRDINSLTETCSVPDGNELDMASIEAEDGEYVIEENNRMTQTNSLRLARSLLTVTDRKTHIWIRNPYSRPLKIMKYQTLAYGRLPAETLERDIAKSKLERKTFGLCNAPATFERNMDNVLGNLRWQICLCYLDDSSNFPTHLKILEAVLKCFSESNLTLNDKKCRFVSEELEILGYITIQQGIKPAEYKIKAVRDFPQPKKVKEVQSFLGMFSYYRKFIKYFPLIASPLTRLIRKNTENQEEALHFKALINPPILGHFDPNAATCIYADVSNIGLGATLVQIIGGDEEMISYLSRTQSKSEKNYSTTEKKCLAVVRAISKLRPYLYRRLAE
ncbi:K02A2.6-like [Cordylochernes scorpioides]|uniref:K02A2.6-like n=1 Tax=Cordylochernes scorpioides TaxID=51811 RepID=A0ABY6K7X1_9ARAC|nr:K02A2.6-like [Cordylochernes scorpioides]